MKRITLLFILTMVASKLIAQNEGDQFFNDSQVHEIRFTFYQSNYWDSLVDGYNGDYYIKGDVEVDGTLYQNCGLKLKGNSSYNNPSIKKSFKIDFNEYVSGQKHDGLKKINLNNGFKDPTFMREKLMLDFLKENNAYAPRCHYANLYINNTLWGLYSAVEEIDKTFLEYNFGDKKGNLFKGDPNGDLKWLGTTQSSYETKYELKTNETANNWNDLIAFINTLNNTSSNLDIALDTIFDSENYMLTWAAHNLFANLDSYIGSGHNYYMYFDSTALIFRFITWDVNEAFGNFSQGMNLSQLEQLSYTYVPNPSGSRPLTEKLVQNSNYLNQYITRLCDLLQYNYSIYSLGVKIDSLAPIIRPYVYADPNKFYSNQQFEDNMTMSITGTGPGGNTIPGLKPFIINRRNAMVQQLSGFCILGEEELENNNALFFPNPTNENISYLAAADENKYFICNVLGECVLNGSLIMGNNIISLASLGEGIYFISVLNNNQILKTEKIIKI